MRKSIAKFMVKNENKIMAVQAAVTTAVANIAASNVAYAAVDTSDIASLVCKILGGGAGIMGGIRLLTGIISYANAQDDQNGPELKKAEGKISAGIILVAVGVVVIALSGKLAGWMSINL